MRSCLLVSWVLVACSAAVGCRNAGGIDSVYDAPKSTGSTGATSDTGPTGSTGGGREPEYVCSCAVAPGDADGDCEPDAIEDTSGNGSYDASGDFSDLGDPDTDDDGILDGCEDFNHNGVVDSFPPESNPKNADSDGDGIPDGLEDRNRNGHLDPGESSSTSNDGDSDGIPDGDEDRNHNGEWDCPEDPSGPPCETRADLIDTDGDGLLDVVELKAFAQTPQNFKFCSGTAPDPCTGPLNATCTDAQGKRNYLGMKPFDPTDDQTCPWQVDSDGDGLEDGVEDKSADGRVSSGETNPRDEDSDDDGLLDGVEDTNKDGLWDDVNETDPTRVDTDRDGIADGVEDSGGCLTLPAVPPAVGATCSGAPSTGVARCICGFWRDGAHQPFESDPRRADTDGDGLKDGAEDRNGDGICQLPAARDVPRASDETCAYDNDSDGDSLFDGAEDINGNGLIDAALNETDARRADPDNDCLTDPYEIFTGTDPFRPDTDDDGLADGLETDRRLRFDQATRTCIPLRCGGSQSAYATPTCPNPTVRDSDGDGFVDGYELINGVPTGEDENADGCKALLETNPCVVDTPTPPTIGDPLSQVCGLPEGSECLSRDIGKCDTCVRSGPTPNYCGGDPSTCFVEGQPCGQNTPCKVARKTSQALICAEGNIRPVVLVRSNDNDYSLALPGVRGDFGLATSLYEFAESTFGASKTGHLFQSKSTAEVTDGKEPIRGVFGGITRLGTIELGTPDKPLDDPPLTLTDGSGSGNVIASSSLTPSDAAAFAYDRVRTRLAAAGYVLGNHTPGGNVSAHDDESGTGRANASVIRRANDRYTVRRLDGGQVETAQVARLVGSALIGGNEVLNPLVPPASYFRGPVAEMRVTFYKRLVKRRIYTETGTSRLTTVAQFGAIWALADLDQDCSALSAEDRRDCRERNEAALNPVDDIANGSALARVQAEVGRACDSFDPQKAKIDFLMVIDDSVSMQKNIIAIQRGARDVASRLRANVENMDWRIGMTTSNMGGSGSAEGSASFEDYVPMGTSGTYPELNPLAPPAEADAFVAYQHTAFDNDGFVKACEYGEYSAQNPLRSPYCCHYSDDNGSVPPLTFLNACCSLKRTGSTPASFSFGASFPTNDFNLNDADANGYGAAFDQQDTLRCYDFPRLAEDLSGWAGAVPRYPLSGNNPTQAQRMRHWNDYLCGKLLDGQGPPLYGYAKAPVPIWGARGHLWPPGFSGIDANPRKDGANLLVRNADMLVVQMNRDCTGNDSGGNMVWSPRARNGSAAENLLQAAKRAVERATAAGRTGTATALREDAPLITVLLSDEEDFVAKAPNATTARDFVQLPSARCLNNGDLGCTSSYCQGCFANAIDQGDPASSLSAFATPAARRFDELTRQIVEDPVNGSYCVAPVPSASNANANTPVTAGCAPPNAQEPFCSATTASSARYSGNLYIDAGVDENALASELVPANGIAPDVLNDSIASGVSCSCSNDCGACSRFLRERPYIDFFGGACSSNDVSNVGVAVPADDPRRYPRPAANVSGGKLLLPLGPVYAITRTAGKQGGNPGSCGSTYKGGDGEALRDIALATGGAIADICPQNGASEPNFSEFLDQIIVDAQGIGSPYRLRGNPISSTIRVGVLDKLGNFRLLKRSNISGFDYNASTNTVAFFSKGAGDLTNQVSLTRDALVYVSYRVWQRECPEDCPLGDACAICTCSAARPDCCTATPTFECQPPTPCAQGCGPCETCDYETNQCRPVSACEDSCAPGSCTTGTGGPACGSGCPPGSTRVDVPCVPLGEGGTCPTVPLTVCISQQGTPNTGASCSSRNQPDDCCGASKTCASGEICVVEPCAGESCLPTATCKAVTANLPPDGACGTCPTGTICAPVPCQAASCPPKFACVASNAGSSASCQPSPECSCPGGICADCAVGSYCNTQAKCAPLCDASVSLTTCCTDASKRNPMLECCPPGDIYDPATGECSRGGYSCNCPADSFCDPYSGRCIRRGG